MQTMYQVFYGYKSSVSKYESILDLAQSLQKNIFAPEGNLRNYSVRLWLLLTHERSELVSREFLDRCLSFLDNTFGEEDDDFELGIKSFIAHSNTFSLLLEQNVVKSAHLEASNLFQSYKAKLERYLKFTEEAPAQSSGLSFHL